MSNTFTLNGRQVTVDADPSTPILWAVRDNLGLTGTKFGCGLAQCGTCTVHINGKAVRSCSYHKIDRDGRQSGILVGR
jgi:isoquinoline 1-oxidoreductase alpha subunit